MTTVMPVHPVLIDLDTGCEYEWTGAGYAPESDHGFSWSRRELERGGCRLVETSTLTPGRFLELRLRYAQQHTEQAA